MTSNVKWSLRRECRFLLLFALPCLLAAAPPAETTAPPAAVKKPRKLDPRDAWIAAQPRFIQADREICEAIEARLASIKNYLEERKAGARPFAAAVLSLKGKMLYTEGVATQVVDAVAGLSAASHPRMGLPIMSGNASTSMCSTNRSCKR